MGRRVREDRQAEQAVADGEGQDEAEVPQTQEQEVQD